MPKTALAYDDYVATPLPDVPGATLISYHEHGRDFPVAVNHGIFDGIGRAMEAHALHVRIHAARDAVTMQDGAIQRWLAERSGRSATMLAHRDNPRDMRRRAEERLLASLILRGDAYRSTRAIEGEYRVEGDDALHAMVRDAMAQAAETARTSHARQAAAQSLADASPARSTALWRHRLVARGEPPSPDAPFPVEGDPNGVCLGTVLVEPMTCANPVRFTGRIEVTVTATLDTGFVEFDADGNVEVAGIDLKVVHDPALWLVARDGLLYGDRAVEAAVNGLLERRGLKARAGWSERGRQDADAGDMDVDPVLATELWPGIVDGLRRSSHAPVA